MNVFLIIDGDALYQFHQNAAVQTCQVLVGLEIFDPRQMFHMDTSQSGGVVGTPVIINHQNTSTYGKHISGTVGVGTQSNSSNMETIQIFVAYAHSTVSVTFSADVALQWKQVGMSINFTPQKKTTIIARGNATFKYNGQGYQTAGTV